MAEELCKLYGRDNDKKNRKRRQIGDKWNTTGEPGELRQQENNRRKLRRTRQDHKMIKHEIKIETKRIPDSHEDGRFRNEQIYFYLYPR